MVTPTVSICVATYNHEPYIAQAIESVLMQRTNFPIEILIGEDCSLDRTREIVIDLAAKHPDVIRLRLAEKNQGAGRNFLDLFAQCRGKYVVILEGDDFWTSPKKLQVQVDALEARRDWAMCFHPAWTVYDDGRESHLYPVKQPKDESTIDDLLAEDFMATTSVMFRNHLIKKYPDWFSDVVVGDWVVHILNALHGNIGFLPEPMSVFRVHSGGIFSSKGLEFKLVTIFKMFAKLDHFLDGRFMRQIDDYRLRTLTWLVGQLESEQRTSKELSTRAQHLEATLLQLHDCELAPAASEIVPQSGSKPSRLAAHLVQLESRLVHAETEAAALLERSQRFEDECQQMQGRLAELQDFHDRWNKALMYRVYRETVRPFQRLRDYLKRPNPTFNKKPRSNEKTNQRRAA